MGIQSMVVASKVTATLTLVIPLVVDTSLVTATRPS
jgi:hypothetical protein